MKRNCERGRSGYTTQRSRVSQANTAATAMATATAMYKKQISIDIKFDSVINDYTNVIQILRDKSLIVCIFSVAHYASLSEWH